MEGLLAILRAAHCRSTHHYFAIDALRHVRTEQGRQLARMLLRYHPQYLAGAKDPDTRFRDFQNHVVHVADNHWGGAPRAAERWYGRLQQFLRTESWADAAHAAGILSHYFTDPLQPLHTAQSARESVVHRPLEWSICKSYNAILSRWRDDRFRIVFRLSTRPDWLASAVLKGAELAHRSYETLVATYDLQAARRDPRQGLSEPALESLAELFGVAIVGWARVLDRTALEADGHIPEVKLLPSAVLASIKVPYAFVLRRVESNRERQAVADLLDYYLKHGDLGVHTPDEVRLIQKVLKVREAEHAYAQRLQVSPELQEMVNQASHHESPDSQAITLRVVSAEPLNTTETTDGQAESERPAELSPTLTYDSVEDRPNVVQLPNVANDRRRSAITLASPIVDAPSIGPKTAARFEAIGINNISQFLGSSPEQMVQQLRVRWIGVEQIADWQAQTRLMMSLPLLRVRDAQLLVGVGIRETYSLASSEPNQLTEKLIRHANTPVGKRSLRGAVPPKLEDVTAWIQDAVAATKSVA